MHSISGTVTTIPKTNTRDLNSIDTPNRKAFLWRQDSKKEEHSTVLGKGAFGTVLQATYRSIPVAVKLLKRRDCEDTWPNEQNILDIHHENIIRMIKITKEEHYFLIIMERLNGNNLHYILNSTAVPLVHQLRIILQVCKGLEYLHEHNIIHLDIKPANILVCPASECDDDRRLLVKLCDLGNSQRLKPSTTNKPPSMTLKKLSGTVAFMAPEMLKKYSVSPASDVYALAVTIWQLLHRKLPYSSGFHNEEQVIYGVVKNNLRPTTRQEEEAGRIAVDNQNHWGFFKKSPPEQEFLPKFTALPTTEGLTWHQQHLEYSGQSDSDDSLIGTSSGINWAALLSVDRSSSIIPLSALKLRYQELYIKCWHRKPTHRPLIKQIIVQLNDLLRNFA